MVTEISVEKTHLWFTRLELSPRHHTQPSPHQTFKRRSNATCSNEARDADTITA